MSYTQCHKCTHTVTHTHIHTCVHINAHTVTHAHNQYDDARMIKWIYIDSLKMDICGRGGDGGRRIVGWWVGERQMHRLLWRLLWSWSVTGQRSGRSNHHKNDNQAQFPRPIHWPNDHSSCSLHSLPFPPAAAAAAVGCATLDCPHYTTTSAGELGSKSDRECIDGEAMWLLCSLCATQSLIYWHFAWQSVYLSARQLLFDVVSASVSSAVMGKIVL